MTFGLMHLTPGGPYDFDARVPEPVRQNLNRKYGLDKPLPQQYGIFLANAVQGDLGVSLKVQQNEPVTDMLIERIRPTVVLGVTALVLAIVLGLALGVSSALNRNRLPDYGAVLVSTGGAALPAFVVGVILIYVFAIQLHWLPTFGWSPGGGVIPGWLPRFQEMVLPVITLALLPLAYLARITRASLLEVLQQDYMRTARAKGLHQGAVVWRHGMRNAAIPIVTILAPAVGALLTGSFVVENMFAVPGVGTLFVNALKARDYNLIMGMSLFYATVALVLYLLVDVAYAYLDPRVRYR